MAQFRKRPITIEAVPYRGDPAHAPAGVCVARGVNHPAEPHIHTLEGVLIVAPGDWIIRGTRGEYYPCKPDIATPRPAQRLWGSPSRAASMHSSAARGAKRPVSAETGPARRRPPGGAGAIVWHSSAPRTGGSRV